jgi:hypothetical protein
MCLHIIARLECDIERFCKPIAEVVACAALKRLTIVHHRLYSVGSHSPRELLAFCFYPADYRYCEAVFPKLGVYFEHLASFRLGFLGSFVQGVAFLPQKFHMPQERPGGFLPAHN